MIPVEQLIPGDVVTLPNGKEVAVVRVEEYDGRFVVVYADSALHAWENRAQDKGRWSTTTVPGLEKTMRIMDPGDLVDARRAGDPELEAGDEQRELRLLAQQIANLIRSSPDGLTDSDIVERMREHDVELGRPLTQVSLLARARRMLSRDRIIESTSDRRNEVTGGIEHVWRIGERDQQQTIAEAYIPPEPDI